MKSCFYLILTFLCLSAANAQAQSKRLHILTIEWENFQTRTFVAVSCDDFQSNFSGSIKRIDIKDKRQLRKAENLLHKFSAVNEPAQIDTRGKITLHDTEGMVKQYCFDGFGNFSNGTVLLKNKKMWRCITKIIHSG